MSNFISAVKAFIDDEKGVTAIEYGLIAALIGVAMVTAATALGTQISTTFNDVVTRMGGAATGGGATPGGNG